MRFPVATPLASRDGTTAKDEHLVNCYVEEDVETRETSVIKRAGLQLGDAVLTGNDIYGQGAFTYGGYTYYVIGDTIFWYDINFDYVDGSAFGATGFWDSGETYGINDTVIYNGIIWYSQTGGNTNHEPSGGSPYWDTVPNDYELLIVGVSSGPCYWDSSFSKTALSGGSAAVAVAGDVIAGYTTSAACTWDLDGTRHDLNTYAGGTGHTAKDIDEDGTIVGYFFLGAVVTPCYWVSSAINLLQNDGDSVYAYGRRNGITVGFGYPSGTANACYWDVDGVLNYLSASASTAVATNGTAIVGSNDFGGGSNGACRWDGGTPTFLGTLGGTISEASGISDTGDIIVGWSRKSGSTRAYPCYWDNGSITELPNLGGSNTYATQTNGSIIVGYGQESGFTTYYPCYWDADKNIHKLSNDAGSALGIRRS